MVLDLRTAVSITWKECRGRKRDSALDFFRRSHWAVGKSWSALTQSRAERVRCREGQGGREALLTDGGNLGSSNLKDKPEFHGKIYTPNPELLNGVLGIFLNYYGLCPKIPDFRVKSVSSVLHHCYPTSTPFSEGDHH